MPSFVTALQCYIYYQRFLGAYPVRIRGHLLEPSKPLQAISLTASVGLIIFAASVKYKTSDDGVLALVVEAVSILAMLGVATAWVSLALQAKKICGAFRALHEADLLLKTHDLRLKLRYYTVAAWAWTGFFLAITLSSLLLELLYPLWVLTGTLRWIIVHFYFTLLMLIMSNLSFLELTAAWRFRAINRKLRSICLDAQRQSLTLSMPFEKFPKRTWTAWEGPSTQFHKICSDLQKSHILISNACSDFLCVYTVPLFFYIAHATSELCCNVYKTLALPMVHQTSLNFIILFNSCKWAILSMLRFVTLVGSFSYVASQGNETLGLVLELQAQINEPQLRRQLDTFVLQLIRPLEFRPLALFTLDMGLFLGMLGTVATYVVILLQLHAAAPDIPIYVSQ